MKDNIRFKGLTLNRDEMSVDNGECSLCGGVEVHDGALRASVLQGTVLVGDALPFSDLLYVHETDDYTHFIGLFREGFTYKLAAFKEGSGQWVSVEMAGGFNTTGLMSIKSVGNTLILMKDDNVGGVNHYDGGLYYFLCYHDGSEWKYKYLGQQPPFLQIQFNLDPSAIYQTSNFEEYEYKLPEEGFFDENDPSKNTIAKEHRSSFTDHVFAQINRRIDKTSGKGLFWAPFLIRYCYRMFDGSMVMHSPPVLMMPILHRPALSYSFTMSHWDIEQREDNEPDRIIWNLFMNECKLQARVIGGTDPVDGGVHLSDWKDIIRSVDVFITPQFSRFDTSKMVERFDTIYDEFNYALAGGEEINVPSKFEDTYSTEWPGGQSFGYGTSIVIPEYSIDDFFSRIRRASYFYKLTSIELEDIGSKLGSSFRNLQFEDSVLHNIAVQPQMKDDYKTHNKLIPASDKAGMYIYNERLNVYSISERLFTGFNMAILFPWTGDSDNYLVRTYIKTESGTFAVECSGGLFGATGYNGWLVKNGYIFYPDARATVMCLYGNLAYPDAQRRLTESDELNGALSFCDDSQISDLPSFINRTNDVPPAVVNDKAVVPLVNKVYTSRAGNPFYFPNLPEESGINSVGTGSILGLAVVTRGLSQGQVGDHDLIVFCTDGIWVGKVTSTGTYSNLHNISREICDNHDSICQLDQSVVFATSRALNRFVEQNVILLTDVLDGPYFDVREKLAAFADAYCNDDDPHPSGYDYEADALIRFATPPTEYYNNGKVLYDYISSRLIILPGDTSESSVALVFSIRDGAWSTMVLPPIQAAINAYPHPYVQFTDSFGTEHMVMRLDRPYDYDDAGLHTGVVVTRTLTYSDTMDVVRGFRQLTDSGVMPVLFFFGSNDQRSWQLIGNSQRAFHNYIPGHPYRFFRIAMYIRMKTSEKYQQLILEIINKYAKL